jgi:UDP-N-acetyl-D-galactosamine dehydrogenase
VDPYYLTHKSQQIGYHPEMILAGRRINDNMGLYVASEVVKRMVRKGMSLPKSRILVLGFTFKENCPDVRNTRVVDLVRELRGYGCSVEIYDPWADPPAVHEEYGIDLMRERPAPGRYDAIVLAVAHQQFRDMGGEAIRALGRTDSVLYDIKSVLPAAQVDGRL